jgi:hypothetical protein
VHFKHHIFLSFTSRGIPYPCALVQWFVVVGDAPCSDTGMWIVKPEMDNDGTQVTLIIHVDSIVRGAHLIGVYGEMCSCPVILAILTPSQPSKPTMLISLLITMQTRLHSEYPYLIHYLVSYMSYSLTHLECKPMSYGKQKSDHTRFCKTDTRYQTIIRHISDK